MGDPEYIASQPYSGPPTSLITPQIHEEYTLVVFTRVRYLSTPYHTHTEVVGLYWSCSTIHPTLDDCIHESLCTEHIFHSGMVPSVIRS